MSTTARPSLRPAVAQLHRAVEDEAVRGAVEISAEIALALELNRLSLPRSSQCGLHSAPGQGLERVRIEIGNEIAARAGVELVEKRVVEPDFRWHGIRRRDPMQSRPDLAS